MTYRVWTMLVLMALVTVLGTGVATPQPAHANDAAAIIAGVAVGYLVYRALDNDDRSYRPGYDSYRYPNYNPPRGGYDGYRETPRKAYDRGYGDGWNDGERYGEARGYRNGWNNGSRTGYSDSSWGYRGGSYSPPPAYNGGRCY